jgi:hypothetical protein
MTTLRHPRSGSIGHALVIGRDVLLALWSIAVLAFWISIVAGFVV